MAFSKSVQQRSGSLELLLRRFGSEKAYCCQEASQSLRLRLLEKRGLSQQATGGPQQQQQQQQEGGVVFSPAVRYLLGTHNIADASAIQASGPKSRLLKGDVLKYLEELKQGKQFQRSDKSPKKSPTTSTIDKRAPSLSLPRQPPSYTDLPLSRERLEEARELCDSKQAIPHVYFSAELNLPLWVLRENASVRQAFMITSLALTLEKFPEATSTFAKDDSSRIGGGGGGGANDMSSVAVGDEINVSHFALVESVPGVMTVVHRVVPSANRLSLWDTVKLIEQGSDASSQTNVRGNVRGNISIYQSLGSDVVKQSTAVLHPRQPLSLYVSAPQPSTTTTATGRGSGSGRSVLATLSGDGRVLSQQLGAVVMQELKRRVTEAAI